MARGRRTDDVEIVDTDDLPAGWGADPPRPRPDARRTAAAVARVLIGLLLLYVAYRVLQAQQAAGLLPDALRGLPRL